MAVGRNQVSQIFQTGLVRGTASHKLIDAGAPASLPIIDNAMPGQSPVRTSIDCYVSGQYVGKGGKIIEVTQRYTIFVSYSKSTQLQTMNEARGRIIADFESRYGKTFNISTVYLPTLPVPLTGTLPPEIKDAAQFYGGSEMFRAMTRWEKTRYDIGTQREMAKVNIESIRKRYKMGQR